MSNKNTNKRNVIILLISILLSIPVILFMLLMIIMTTLNYLLPSSDNYLLTGLSFCVLISILIILVPIIFFFLISKKNNRINDIKKYFKKYKVFLLVCILIIGILESLVIYRGYEYFKDIKLGPQEAIMTNVIVKTKSGYRTHSSYIIGYIDNEKIQLELTQDARSSTYSNNNYKIIKIKYYKNIKEVYYIEIY